MNQLNVTALIMIETHVTCIGWQKFEKYSLTSILTLHAPVVDQLNCGSNIPQQHLFGQSARQ